MCFTTKNPVSYIKAKTEKVADCKLGGFAEHVLIDDAEMFFLTVNPDKYGEKLLIDYYNAWVKKSKLYLAVYLEKKAEAEQFFDVSYSRDKQVQYFLNCNENCYRILLALEKNGSKFASKQKIREHRDLRGKVQKEIKISRPRTVENIDEKKLYKSIKLNRNYNSIGEINFDSEPAITKLMDVYQKPDCFVYIVYNKNIGFLNTVCGGDFSAYGVNYRIKLVNKNILQLYYICAWMS